MSINWEAFNVGNDISRVILELEANLKMLNNDVVILGFARMYFSGMSENVISQENYILKHRRLASRIQKEVKSIDENARKGILINRLNSVIESEQKKYKEYRVLRYRTYKQIRGYNKNKEEILEAVREALETIEINLSEINLIKIFFVEVAFAIQEKDFTVVNLISRVFQKKLVASFQKMLPFIGLEIETNEGRKRVVDATPDVLEFINHFNDKLLIPKQGSKDFDLLFAFSIRQTPLQSLGSFLMAQSENFNGDFNEFLKLITLEFGQYFTPAQLSFLKSREIESSKIGIKNEGNLKSKNIIEIKKSKGLKRNATDKRTNLSLSQTGLLFQLLKTEGIILNSIDYQPDTELAKAIEALTGYSHKNIRPKLGQGLNHVDTKENDVIKLKQTLSKLLDKLNKHT